MKYAIVYSSRTGNTRLLAQTLQELLPREDCVYFGPPDAKALGADRIYAGFWTDKGCCDGDTRDFLKQLTDQQVFLFGTAGFGGDAGYFEKILSRTVQYLPKGVQVTGSFLCQGKMPMSVRARYVQMRAAHVPNMDKMLENFDRALRHPDADDLEQLKKAVRAVL